MIDVSTLGYTELRALIEPAYAEWDGLSDPVFTGIAAEARAELDRRSDESERAFNEMIDRHGGKAAFDYEVRDSADGMGGHAFDLIADQFFGLDEACGGDYAAAEARAMARLASMERVGQPVPQPVTTMNRSQIAWASHHDWFVGDNLDGTIMVRDCYLLDGVLHDKVIVWTEGFAALRDWAGY